MVVSDNKDHAPGIDNAGPYLMMNPFSSRCCQHNHAMGWPYYAEHLWMATPDNGVVAMLYNSSEVDVKVGDGKNENVHLKQTTRYPFDQMIKIEVNTNKEVRFPLYLRIPSWCSNAKIILNGNPQSVSLDSGSYARIDRLWSQGDVIQISLPMTLKKDTWAQNKSSVSINYGPLTFSLKIGESYQKVESKMSAQEGSKWQENVDQSKWPSYNLYPSSLWNYGLLIEDSPLEEQFEIIKRQWPTNDFPFTQETVPFSLKAKGKLIPEWMLDKNGLCDVLPQSPVKTATMVDEIELIPMGAARLRISSFPVVH